MTMRRPGFDCVRMPLLCLAGFAVLLILPHVLPAWAVVPPKAWTENLPLPFLIFREGSLPSFSLKGSSIVDWFNAIVQFIQSTFSCLNH